MALQKIILAKFQTRDRCKREVGMPSYLDLGGNDESKKMQNQLKSHGAGVSTEDANQKFQRSLPSAGYKQVAKTHKKNEELCTNKTGRKLQFDAKEPISFDKTKVECYNCHKTGHFARECRSKGTQDNKRRDAWNSRNKDRSKKLIRREDTKAWVTIDGKLRLRTQREHLRDASIEIKDNPQVLRKFEAQLVCTSTRTNLDSEDECVSIPTKQQETPSFANKQVKTPRETVKNQFTHNQKPKVDKKDLGHGFTPAVLTRTGKIPVNTARASGTKNVSTARHSFNRQAVLTSTAMKVNTVKPIVNRVRPANVFHKTHSPSSRPFKKTTVLRTNFSKQKVNTAKVNAVSTVWGKRETAVKPSAGCNWRPQRYNWQNDYPHRALKNKGIVDSGCSRHMTGNKAYLAEFQDFNGGPVAFGGSKGYITGKGTEDIIDAGDSEKEDESAQDCFVLPIWSSYSSTITPDLKTDEKREGPREEEQVFLDELERLKRQEKDANKEAEALRKEFAQATESLILQAGAAKASSTNIFSTVSTPAKASSTNLVNTVSTLSDPSHPDQDDSEIPLLEDIYQNSSDALILGDPTSAVQTRSKVNKSSGAHAFVSYVQKQRRNNHKDFQH
ncbi:ribonuclease H-like domain-containing protein, partial [Tanacetum coccineum]